MAFLSGYTKRKHAYWVRNNGVQANYQIQIVPHKATGTDSGKNVYLGTNVQDDFDDFRLTKGDESTLLDQWRESYTSGSLATYWGEVHKVGSSLLTANANAGQPDVTVSSGTVFAANDYIIIISDTYPQGEIRKISSIAGNVLTLDANLTNTYTTAANAKVCHCIFVYYKNDAAALSSNGANTFVLFNDGTSITGWTARPISGTPTWAATTVVQGNFGTSPDRKEGGLLCNTVTGLTAYIVEAKVQQQLPDEADNIQGGLSGDADTSGIDSMFRWCENINVWRLSVGGTEVVSSVDNVFNATVQHLYKLLRHENYWAGYVDDSLKVSQTKIYNVQYVGFWGADWNNTASWQQFDDFRVRKYVDPEPTWGTWGSEETHIDVLTRFKLWVRGYKDIATRFQIHVQGYRDTSSRFVLGVWLWATSFIDADTRFRLIARNYTDIATRFRLGLPYYKDIATRFKLWVLNFRDTATRFWVVVEGFGDVVTYFRLVVLNFRDVTTLFVITALATRDVATRFIVHVLALKDVKTRFKLYALSYMDIVTRFRVYARSSVDTRARFRLRATGAFPIIGGSHVVETVGED